MKKVYFFVLFIAIMIGFGALPTISHAVGVPNFIKPLTNLTTKADPATVVEIIIGAYLAFASLITVFAFGFLVFAGFKMIIAGGNPEALTTAKNGMLGSVLGLMAALLSVTVILGVNSLLGGTGFKDLNDANNLHIPISVPSVTNASTPGFGFLDVFVFLFKNIIGLAFVVCVVMVIYGGYRLIASAGNEESVTAGKSILTWAIAGLAVVMLSYMLIFGISRILTPTGGGGTIETQNP